MAINWGIGQIIAGVDYLIHKAERIKEAAKEAKQAADEITSSYSNLSSKVADIKQRYAELAQRVNQVTGENKTLSTDEYTEFLDLSNQLAELFPSLTRKYNDNGDAILNLSGDINTITGSLNALVETERTLANKKIIEEIPDILKGYNQDYFGTKKDLTAKEIWKDKLQLAYDSLQDLDKRYNRFDTDYYNQICEVLNELGIDFIKINAADSDDLKFHITDYENAMNEISSALRDTTNDVSNYNNKLRAETADFNKYLNTWLVQDWAYVSLDGELQDVVREMLFNTDWLSEAKKQNIDTTNWDKVSEWIEDNYILAIGNIDDEKVKNALLELYSLPSDLSPTQVKEIVDEYIPLIAKAIGKDELDLKIALGFEDADTIAKNYTSTMQKALKKYGGISAETYGNDPESDMYYEQVSDELTKFAEENSINTQDEIAFWNQCIEESATKEEAMEKYLASKFANFDDDTLVPTISSSIATIATQLEPQFTELGKLYNEIFQTDDNGNVIFSPNSVDFSTLESLRNSFAEIGKDIGVTFDPAQLDTFFDVLYNRGTKDEVQQAFNDLATAYLYSTDTLEQLNDETANAIKKQLEQMGITNAEAVVAGALALKNEELALSKEYLAQKGKELADATDSEVLAFMAEQAGAGYCGKVLAALQLQKLLVNGTLLDTETDINNVMALATVAGIATTSLSEFAALKDEYENARENFNMAETEWDKEEALKDMADISARMETAKKQFEDEVNNFNLDPVGIEYKAPDSSKSSSAAEQAEKDWKNVLDKETDLLEKQLAANVITFKEYTDKRRQIIEDYYRDGKIKAEEYYDALESMYDHQLSLYDRVVNAVTDRIDDEIDRLNEQKEAIENSYQVKIDAIQEEIDALNKANDARKAQIDLEKAQYEAERARNQRVNKVYDGSQFVYAADTEAVRDAEDDLADKEFQMNISQLETQIELLKEEMENATKSLDNQINALESYKEKWDEISGIYEEQQNRLIAAELLGADWESQVLNGRLDTLRNFTEQYIALLQAQADAAANAKGGNEETPPAFYGKKYASGTDHARKGLNLVGEDGTETFIDNDGNVALVTKPTLIPMEGGEVVKNAEETKAMLDTKNLEPVQSEELRSLFERIRNMQPSDFNFQNITKPLETLINLPNNELSPVFTTSAAVNIVQNNTINCPNVTNNSGAEYIMKELRRLPLDTIQFSHRRNK
ncbi:MAG: hypothetical protein K2I22_05565 [Lachnospiraceae bacterium]|nr:hypothetical protein [Lachnospiraceae bacterium]